jgi:tRNA(fMet)-specific endonuclease VapC
MAALYLLDTNTVSYIVKGNNPTVDRHLAGMPISRITISSVTEGELRYGIARKPEASRLRKIVDSFLQHVTILPWDSKAAQEYGNLRAALEQEGHSMGNLNTMIAAHALAVKAVVVTSDRAFSRIKRLKIEDWSRSAGK